MGGNKRLTCEFCNVRSRSDYVAEHIRSKCKVLLTRSLLKNWDRQQPLQTFIDSLGPIPSNREGHYYVFGVRSKLVPKEKLETYLTEERKEAHRQFLQRLLTSPQGTEPVSSEKPDHIGNTGHTEVASPSHTHTEVSSCPSTSY